MSNGYLEKQQKEAEKYSFGIVMGTVLLTIKCDSGRCASSVIW